MDFFDRQNLLDWFSEEHAQVNRVQASRIRETVRKETVALAAHLDVLGQALDLPDAEEECARMAEIAEDELSEVRSDEGRLAGQAEAQLEIDDDCPDLPPPRELPLGGQASCVAQLSAKCARLSIGLERAREELAELERRRNEEQGMIREQASRLKDITAQLDNAHVEMQTRHIQLVLLERELGHSLGQRKELERLLRSPDTSSGQQKGGLISLLTAQRDELETELRVIQVERCELRRDLRILREQRSEPKHRPQEGADKGGRLQEPFAARLAADHAELEIELHVMRIEHSELYRELERSRSQRAELERRLQDRDAEDDRKVKEREAEDRIMKRENQNRKWKSIVNFLDALLVGSSDLA